MAASATLTGVGTSTGSIFWRLQHFVTHRLSDTDSGQRIVKLTKYPPPPPGVGGWVRGQTKVCASKMGLKIPALLMDVIFCLKNIFRMWVGG